MHVLIALALVAACGDDDAPSDDAGATPDAVAIAAPALPEAPRFDECPAGWTHTRFDEGLAYCEPTLGECADPDAALPGGLCADVARPCPSDGFAADLPTDRRVIYGVPAS